MKTHTLPITIRERIPNPVYTLEVPQTWNGRDELEISPSIVNLAEMKSEGVGDLNYSWKISGMATVSETDAGKLVLKRAQNSGTLTVALALDNGGDAISQSASIIVTDCR